MENYLLHTDFSWGFRIKYPADWRKLAVSPDVLGFFSPAESPTDIFQANVKVGVVETIFSSLREHVDFASKILPPGGHWLIGARVEITVANLPAERIEMVGPDPFSLPQMIPVRILHVFVMKGKRAYKISYSAQAEAYQKFMPQYRAMLESFELA